MPSALGYPAPSDQAEAAIAFTAKMPTPLMQIIDYRNRSIAVRRIASRLPLEDGSELDYISHRIYALYLRMAACCVENCMRMICSSFPHASVHAAGMIYLEIYRRTETLCRDYHSQDLLGELLLMGA